MDIMLPSPECQAKNEMKPSLKFRGAEIPSDSGYDRLSCSADNEGDVAMGVISLAVSQKQIGWPS